ncbi:MAG: NAD(P)/FAD-dependent oxidoreductase [Chloroflexi bacterium]|nr:NAD(P)/FAD-dependent oxidoreductase [Chloroflexota bacterium]
MTLRYLIIGSGPAGLRAAEEIRGLAPDGEIFMVSEDSRPPYYRYYLPDVVANTKGEDKLPIHPPEFYLEQRIGLVLGKRVTSVDTQAKSIALADGSSLAYDSLLIATGSFSRPGVWPGADLDGVVYLRHWDEMVDILDRLARSKRGVVAGGGLLGIELAWGFRARGLAVDWLIRDSRFWPQMMDAPASRILEEKVEAAGVSIRKDEEIKDILGVGGKVVAVRTARGEEIPAEVVGVAIGAVPSLQFLAGSDVKIDRGILVDEYLRSSVPDVYAAGDIAQIYDPVHGDYRVHTNWDNAERQGKVAGANMAGQSRKLEGGIDHNLMKLYEVPFVSMGLANPTGEGFDILTKEEPGTYRKLVLKDGRIVGAALVGDIKGQRAVHDLIVSQIDVSANRDHLLDPGFSIASLVPKPAAIKVG